MSLEQIKELIKCGNILFQDKDTKKAIKKDSEELIKIKNYQIVESVFGVGYSEKGNFSVPQTLKIIKENPDTNYILYPIR